MEKSDKLESKLKLLPRSSGVYFHKDANGEIIYVGKAAILKNRVRQYFQSTKVMDSKTKALVSEIDDVDWVETETEIDALFLEAEMVRRYMPRFNILLRDDKSLLYIRIDMKSDWPFVSYTRNPIDDKAEYFGPYYNGHAVKKALRYLRKVFPYYIKSIHSGSDSEASKLDLKKKRLDLDDHLGLSPVNISSEEYKQNLRKLISYINGNRKKIVKEIELEMKQAAAKFDFESAAKHRNKLYNIKELQRRIVFGDKEFLDISKDKALVDLTELLNLSKIPKRIEGFDISHMSGTNVVASMVVFKNGASDRAEYRKFKIKVDQNNDFFNMKEAISRRFSVRNIKSWGTPDLVLIDGGKGQLDAALNFMSEINRSDIVFIGLAKRDEQIVVKNTSLGIKLNQIKLTKMNGYVEKSDDFTLINLPKDCSIIKLLQRIRDESHRFAVSYHTVLKRKKQTESLLDEIPGIGAKTKSKMIKAFGSVNGIKSAPQSDVVRIVGISKAKLVLNYIKNV